MMFIYILYALLAAFFLAMVRNTITYKHRIAILETKTADDPWAGNELHRLLPSYDAMMFHPAFWLKWTEADWREYLAARALPQVGEKQ